VRDRVARARWDLPRDLEPPVVDKFDISGFPIMWIPITTERPQVDASEFVKEHIKPKVETIPGVAGIEIFGKRERQIRIWLDGDALRARGLAATDIVAALRQASLCGFGTGLAEFAESALRHYGEELQTCFR